MTHPLDELYAGPLETFVARRKELAVARTKAGDAEGAALLKAAVKPTTSAWLVNQVAHRKPALVRDLLAATADVVRSQLDAGGDEDDREHYERALARQKAAEDKVKDALRDLAGNPGGDLSLRVLENFRRGALDAQMREILRAGRLTRDVEPQDFGTLLERLGARAPAARVAEVAAQAARKKAADIARRASEVERRREKAAARERLDRAARAVERLQLELAAAERELAEARAAIDRA